MEVKVSVIIASYNAQATIEKALESVRQQIYSAWECIVIDGASKDRTLEIAKSYEAKDSRFHIFSEPDKGVYDAFNKGWKRAKGEWIYYLGCDDELLPNGLKDLMASSIGVDFVYGGFIRRYKNGKTKIVSPGNFEQEMPYSLATSHQAMLMKHSLIERVGGFNLKYKILADYDLINHAYSLGMKTRKCNSNIAIFQIGGLSTDNLSSLKERYRILVSYHIKPFSALKHCVGMGIFFVLCKLKHNFLDSF